MLTEEAHHMFVGETGILRVVDRTARRMAEERKEHPDDVRRLGVIDLPTMQKYLNLWYSLSLDLFGGEISSNAASFFASGIKGWAKGGATRGSPRPDREGVRDGCPPGGLRVEARRGSAPVTR